MNTIQKTKKTLTKEIIREKKNTAVANNIIITVAIVLGISIIVAMMFFKQQPHLLGLLLILLCDLAIIIVSWYGFSLKYFRKFKTYQPTDEELKQRAKESLVHIRSCLSLLSERIKDCEIVLYNLNNLEKENKKENWFSRLMEVCSRFILGDPSDPEFTQEKLEEDTEMEKYFQQKKSDLELFLKEIGTEKNN
ncbi:MAG: hypothetical protein LBO09_00355 [Candidatus Peribacteria bacterium]|jgi:ABC-type multidrug transport system fused ATPase/permease subunit|nr:hypothetical protein [Candidatus Peribacteria bacterium]